MSFSSYCSNCKIELSNGDSMKMLKDHYKSEFHHYNIKRNLVNLPPITHEQYHKKKLEAMETKTEEKTALKCKTCNKSFSSKATHKQHLDSKKHQEAQHHVSKGTETATENPENKKSKVRVTTAEDQSICLFCNTRSIDINENLFHMRSAHSFFISDLKYIKDVKGLLKYLGEKIHQGCLCIYCENHQCRDFKSGDAVQKHMISKGHCFMKTDDFDEYHKFYDFSKTIDDMKNKLQLGDANEPLKEGEDYLEMEFGDDDDDEESWEEVNEEGEGDNKDEAKEKKEKTIYRFKVKKVKVLDTGEIQLPNGTILGHRNYQHLYKQYFRDMVKKDHTKKNYLENSENTALAKTSEENKLTPMEEAFARKLTQRERFQTSKQVKKNREQFLKLGVRGNKLQHYFRNQNPL